jgi:hypothetical protein
VVQIKSPQSPPHRSVGVHGVFLRALGRPFLRALVVPLFSVLLAVAMADAVVDWATLKEQIASQAPWRSAGLATAMVVAWCLVAGRGFRPLWRQPLIAFLVRQPLGRWRWVVYLTPTVSLGLIPVVGIAWLAPSDAGRIAHYLGYLGLAWPVLLGASFTGRDAYLLVAAGALAFYAAALASSYVPAAVYLLPLLALAGMQLAVMPVRRQHVRIVHPIHASLSGSGIVATIVRRDLRYLLRTQARALAGLALLVTFCAAMMLAFRINGGQQGRDALLSACLLFTVSITTVYEILETLKTGLGKEIMRRRWPVTNAQRALALVTLIGVLVLPGAGLVLLMGSTMGAVHALIYGLFVAAVIVFTAGLFSHLLVAQRSANGLYLLLITGHMVALLALSHWAYALIAAASIPAGFIVIARGFDRFTATMERISIGQLA